MGRKLRVPTKDEVLDAARALGKALNEQTERERGQEGYKDKLYPNGATIRQEMELMKDPKYAALSEHVLRAEQAAWAADMMLKNLVRRM